MIYVPSSMTIGINSTHTYLTFKIRPVILHIRIVRDEFHYRLLSIISDPYFQLMRNIR
jgi:hypothetical protein